jgi:hypothetical protein
VRRLAALNVFALVLFLLAEIVLFFVVTPSPELLALLFPVCHYGILGSLLLALILVATHFVDVLRRRQRS